MESEHSNYVKLCIKVAVINVGRKQKTNCSGKNGKFEKFTSTETNEILTRCEQLFVRLDNICPYTIFQKYAAKQAVKKFK